MVKAACGLASATAPCPRKDDAVIRTPVDALEPALVVRNLGFAAHALGALRAAFPVLAATLLQDLAKVVPFCVKVPGVLKARDDEGRDVAVDKEPDER